MLLDLYTRTQLVVRLYWSFGPNSDSRDVESDVIFQSPATQTKANLPTGTYSFSNMYMAYFICLFFFFLLFSY